MRMRPEDVAAAMNRQVPSDVRCLHATSLVPIPTSDGMMFALRIVSHGDPGEKYKGAEFVPEGEITTTDFGLGEGDLYELASAVLNMLDITAATTQGMN